MSITQSINRNVVGLISYPSYSSMFARRRSSATRPHISNELRIGAMEAEVRRLGRYYDSKSSKRRGHAN